MFKLYYGEDTFSIKEDISAIEKEFIAKEGSDINLSKLDGSNLNLGAFISNVNAAPFLGEKRLIIIKNLLIENSDKELKKKIASQLPSIPESSDVLFVEFGLPDKREGLFKALDKSSKYFPPFDDIKLRTWLLAEFKKEGIAISNPDIFKIAFAVGPDLWRLTNEVSKLSSWARSQKRDKIESGDVDKFIVQTDKFKIFDLTDSIARKDSRRSFQILNSFLESGEDEFMIFNMIIFQFRNMLIISDLAKRVREHEIAKASGIHPFVVKKTLESLRNFSDSRLSEIYASLHEIDFKVKSGESDLGLSIAMLVADLCKV
jgi:DNA polymerase-3 subunit delta